VTTGSLSGSTVGVAADPAHAGSAGLLASTWSTVIETNLTAAFHGAQQAFPLMAEAGRGVIVNIWIAPESEGP
jgi:NAD(P)-dependent dehydrogenase (short-subunit alcohol dehydrogenase family)